MYTLTKLEKIAIPILIEKFDNGDFYVLDDDSLDEIKFRLNYTFDKRCFIDGFELRYGYNEPFCSIKFNNIGNVSEFPILDDIKNILNKRINSFVNKTISKIKKQNCDKFYYHCMKEFSKSDIKEIVITTLNKHINRTII